jgi:hypothetical protein
MDAAMSKVDAQRPQSKAAEPGGKQENASLTTLTFSVKVPGRLLETNGLRDDIDGSVTWGMFAEAPSVEAVTLRATWQQ